MHLVNKKIPLPLHIIFTFFIRLCSWNTPSCCRLFHYDYGVHVVSFSLPPYLLFCVKKAVTGRMSAYQSLSGAGSGNNRKANSPEISSTLKCKRKSNRKKISLQEEKEQKLLLKAYRYFISIGMKTDVAGLPRVCKHRDN